MSLHVGAGTFQPVRADDLKDHVMHREWLNVGAELVQQVRRTRRRRLGDRRRHHCGTRAGKRDARWRAAVCR